MDCARNSSLCEVIFLLSSDYSICNGELFFRRVTTEKLDVNAILSKYARASKVDGIKYFSSKHGK